MSEPKPKPPLAIDAAQVPVRSPAVSYPAPFLSRVVGREKRSLGDAGAMPQTPGMCAGCRGGSGDAHHLVNASDADVVFLELGDRLPGDSVIYSDDDLQAARVDGAWRLSHKDGTPY